MHGEIPVNDKVKEYSIVHAPFPPLLVIVLPGMAVPSDSASLYVAGPA